MWHEPTDALFRLESVYPFYKIWDLREVVRCHGFARDAYLQNGLAAGTIVPCVCQEKYMP